MTSRHIFISCILSFLFPGISAQCGKEGFRIETTSLLKPIAFAWATAYGEQQCGWNNVIVQNSTLEGNFTTQRMITIVTKERRPIQDTLPCQTSNHTAFDIIMTSYLIDEDDSMKPHNKTCNISISHNNNDDTSLSSFITVDIAVDSLSVIVKPEGIANDCIHINGGGLTQDQLKWIFSNNSISQLQAMGWSSSSLLKGTGPLEERRWSRLNSRCSPSWITVVGPFPNTEYFRFFHETILYNLSFSGNTNMTQSTGRPSFQFRKTQDIHDWINNDETSIGFMSYSKLVTRKYKLRPVAIQNLAGTFVLPDATTMESNLYNPLSRRLFMSLWTKNLNETRYFLEFCYSNAGDNILRAMGYSSISAIDQLRMFARIGSTHRDCFENPFGCEENAKPGDCISLATIQCCSGVDTLSIFVTDTTEDHFRIWKIYFEAACPYTQINLINHKQPQSAYFQACKLEKDKDFWDIAAVGSQIHQGNQRTLFPVTTLPYSYKCTKSLKNYRAYSPPRTLLEFVMAPQPKRYLYTNAAPAIRARTRCFLQFVLCSQGTQVIQCNGMKHNGFGKTMETMCKRNGGSESK
jgi:ABC-type phosphate transport system substrate-binding protein